MQPDSSTIIFRSDRLRASCSEPPCIGTVTLPLGYCRLVSNTAFEDSGEYPEFLSARNSEDFEMAIVLQCDRDKYGENFPHDFSFKEGRPHIDDRTIGSFYEQAAKAVKGDPILARKVYGQAADDLRCAQLSEEPLSDIEPKDRERFVKCSELNMKAAICDVARPENGDICHDIPPSDTCKGTPMERSYWRAQQKNRQCLT